MITQSAQTAAWSEEQLTQPMQAPVDSRQPRDLTRRIKSARSPGELAYLWQHQHHRFNQIHVCAALMRLAHITDITNCGPDISQLVHDLCQRVTAVMHLMGPREISSSLWAVATLQHPASMAWVSKMAEAALQHLPQATGQDIGMTVWAIARFGHHPGQAWLQTLTTHLQHRMHTLDGQAVVNVLWAFSTLRYRPADLWLAMCVRSLRTRLHELTPQGHANALWALARMGQACGQAWAAHICMRLSTDLDSFSLRELSMLVFALGRMHQPRTHKHTGVQTTTTTTPLPSAVLHAIALVATAEMGQLNATHMGCLLWGMAHLGHHPGQQMLDSFFHHSQLLLGTADGQTLAHMVLALQRLTRLKTSSALQCPQHSSQQSQPAPAIACQPSMFIDSIDEGSSLYQASKCVTTITLHPPTQSLTRNAVQPLTVHANDPTIDINGPSIRQAGYQLAAAGSDSIVSHYRGAPDRGVVDTGGFVQGDLQQKSPSHCYAPSTQQRMSKGMVQVPSQWANAFLIASQPALASMNPHMSTMCAYALSQLGVRPGVSWQAAFLGAVGSHLRAGRLTGVEIMCVAATLARWRTPLPALWSMQFMQGFRASLPAPHSQPYHSSRTLLALAHLQVLPDPETVEAVGQQFQRLPDQVTAAELAAVRRAVDLLPQLHVSWLVEIWDT